MLKVLLLCVISVVIQGEASWHHLKLRAHGMVTHDELACFNIPEDAVTTGEMSVEVKEGEAWNHVACQVDNVLQRVWFRVPRSVSSQPSIDFRWRRISSPQAKPAEASQSSSVRVTETDIAMIGSIRGKEVVQYNKRHVLPPAELAPAFGRSAHLHPVKTLKGVLVSDEFPPDHAHQSGIYLAYPMTKFRDRELDFWNLAKKQGRVRFGRVESVTSGELYGEFQVTNEHLDMREAKDLTEGAVVAKELWQVRVWNPGSEGNYWWMDITSTMTCATSESLELPEYHYGGMAVRGAREWKPDHVAFLTEKGSDRAAGNHARTKWCQMSGLVGNEPVGLVMMTHPENFRFPEPLRIHATMPYMVYTPSFLGAWKLVPGESHVARYRFVLVDGSLDAQQCEQLWQRFAQPWEAIDSVAK